MSRVGEAQKALDDMIEREDLRNDAHAGNMLGVNSAHITYLRRGTLSPRMDRVLVERGLLCPPPRRQRLSISLTDPASAVASLRNKAPADFIVEMIRLLAEEEE